MKHPEDREDWGQWASDPSNWQRPEEAASPEGPSPTPSQDEDLAPGKDPDPRWDRPEEGGLEGRNSFDPADGVTGHARPAGSDPLESETREDRGVIRREDHEGSGPYNLRPGEVDDRDPLPPRGSTPYNETSPWTNPHAWRYQSQPYDEDPAETRSGCGGIIGMAVLLAAAVIALAWFLL